jgi:magnesium-transporting ATPase (P-type)
MERDLTLIGVTGIQDPVRPDVIDAIKQCEVSEIKVRMVTGDNVLTAIAIAKECGILSPNYEPKSKPYEVLEGPEFRAMVGGLKNSKDKDGKNIKVVKDLYRF